MSAKTEIMSVIAKTDDPNLKTMAILMLAVLEEIGSEIRAMRADEQGLREAVLNGHTQVHDAHHEWVDRQIQQEKEEAAAEKDSKRKIRDGLIEKVLGFVLIAAITASGWIFG